MSPVPTWVVGARGLLGSHVAAALRRRGEDVMTRSVPWHDPAGAREALRAGIRDLVDLAGDGEWNVAWCAGAGIVATAQEQLAAEVEQFTLFLADLADLGPSGERGAIFLASSAGGLYAGSPVRPPFTERSPVRPLVAYGRAKAVMEQRTAEYVRRTGAVALVGRIANLYGPGQDLAKPQGLISQLCLTHVTGRPLTVYVPLDTMRDYVFADDCGDLVAAALSGLRARAAAEGTALITKIIASGQCTTIAALIAESARLFKKRPRVVVKAPVEGTGQVPDLRLRSVVWPELDVHLAGSLTVGMARTAADVAGRTRRSPVPTR